jgi:hypothetical protein
MACTWPLAWNHATVRNKDLKIFFPERTAAPPPTARAPGQAARRWTSQTVAAMSSTDSASSQPPSIHWKGQNRLAGW